MSGATVPVLWVGREARADREQRVPKARFSRRSTGWKGTWRGAVYYSHFKCNLRRLTDYPRLWRHTRSVHALPAIARTVDLREIKAHYDCSMPEINPSRVVPKGPVLDFRR